MLPRSKQLLGLLLIGVLCFESIPLYAADSTSTSFILRDPVIGGGAQSDASSASFQSLFGTDFISIGQNTSTSFGGRFGFQYYPYIQSGVLSAALNGGDVDLSWTASVADTGLAVSEYEVGIATAPGGPYTYTSVALSTTYTYENLSPDTFYFVVRTLDGLGNPIAVSNEETEVVPQILALSISDNSVGFGPVSPSGARYATGDTAGATSETEAHTITASTNAPYGYMLTVQGDAPTNGISTITPIGGSNTAPNPGDDQFGIRVESLGGTGTVTAPYDGFGFAYDADSSSQSVIATLGTGDGDTTVYSVRYLANVDPLTTSGSYGANLTYVLTATF